MRGKVLLSLAAVLAMAGWARATSPGGTVSLFDNFGDGVNASEGYTASGAGATTTSYACAYDFSPSVTANLESITLAFALVEGPNSFTFDLDNDNSGLPGSTLESWTQAANGSFGSFTEMTLESVLHPLLTAGDTYWIAIYPGTTDTWGAWDLTNGVAVDPLYSTDGGSTWISNSGNPPAFSVQGVASGVPTPAALPAGALLLTGLVGCKWLGRKATV